MIEMSHKIICCSRLMLANHERLSETEASFFTIESYVIYRNCTVFLAFLFFLSVDCSLAAQKLALSPHSCAFLFATFSSRSRQVPTGQTREDQVMWKLYIAPRCECYVCV